MIFQGAATAEVYAISAHSGADERMLRKHRRNLNKMIWKSGFGLYWLGRPREPENQSFDEGGASIGNERSARHFSDRSFFMDVRAGCPRQNAIFSGL